MPRPQKNRMVHQPPVFTQFKPVGIGARFMEDVILTIDEYEALRLADYEGMTHEQAAEEMQISRPTFTRLLDSAHSKLAKFLVEGKQLLIEGGNVDFRYNIVKCLDCGLMFRIPAGETIDKCPNCGSTNLVYLGLPQGRGRGGKGPGYGRGRGGRGRRRFR